MSKKLTLLIGVFLALMLLTGVSAYALTVSAGDYRFIFDDYDVFDDPIPVVSPFPGQTSTGNTWGIADLQSYQQRDPVTNAWQTVYVRGQGGKYYTSVTGGLTLEPDITNPSGYNVVPGPGVFPHNSYFIDDIINSTGPGYIKMYEHTSDIWQAAVGAGPNMAGLGAFSSFGGPITTGSLVLDATFNSLALTLSGDPNATPGASVLRAVSNTSTQAGLLSWGDVTGLGAWDPLIDTNTMYAGSDFRMSVDVYYLYDAVTSSWRPISGWPMESVGQIEGNAIPEPATLLLLGTGLLGLGTTFRKRFAGASKKKS